MVNCFTQPREVKPGKYRCKIVSVFTRFFMLYFKHNWIRNCALNILLEVSAVWIMN